MPAFGKQVNTITPSALSIPPNTTVMGTEKGAKANETRKATEPGNLLNTFTFSTATISAVTFSLMVTASEGEELRDALVAQINLLKTELETLRVQVNTMRQATTSYLTN